MFKQSITIFQHGKLNSNVLKNLNNYNFKVNLRDKPAYKDFSNIFDSFLNIHPDNFRILIDCYPEILFNVPKDKRLSKICVQDLNLINNENFEKLKFNGPLIIDNNNHLLANDINSIERVLHNYEYNLNYEIGNSKILNALPVHPHAAEFADLF
ncbi:hypothetical protein CLIB1444_03S11694 [[Candida] jaroonii]|uniref:Uncharacterized protein n=1 Tax=[Candida] jaroonii TaxID=467808 RepID=A0ACA9Y6D3_9ASCO|nr:hypothetical protein CLIB1444_03S11694 [[Candida] jaroonii]